MLNCSMYCFLYIINIHCFLYIINLPQIICLFWNYHPTEFMLCIYDFNLHKLTFYWAILRTRYTNLHHNHQNSGDSLSLVGHQAVFVTNRLSQSPQLFLLFPLQAISVLPEDFANFPQFTNSIQDIYFFSQAQGLGIRVKL